MQLDTSPSQSLDIPGIPSNGAFNNALPVFNIAGYQQIGAPSNTNSNFRTDVTELVDTGISADGTARVEVRTGFPVGAARGNPASEPDGRVSVLPVVHGSAGGAESTGDPLASFLLGQVQQFSIDLQGKVIRPRAHIQEYFVQDDWKATPRLTINAGVRWTLNFPSTDADNQGAVFNLQTQRLDYLGKNGYPRTARELHWHDFGPRLGLSYMLSDKTVIRSGYGLVWIEQTGITTPFTVPSFRFCKPPASAPWTTSIRRSCSRVGPASLPFRSRRTPASGRVCSR